MKHPKLMAMGILALLVAGLGLVVLESGRGGWEPRWPLAPTSAEGRADNAVPPAGADHGSVRLRVIELQSKQVGPGALLVLGDSIMEAMYGDRLCGLPVLNAGVGGMGIDFVAAHVDRMLSWSRPSYVLVSVGINDATRTGSPRSESDLSRWTRTYSSVLDRIEAARAVPLLMTLLPIETDGALGERYFDRATVVDLNRRLRELSEVRNRRLIDGFSAFSDHKGAMKIGSTVDGVHLTGESYRLLRSLIERGLHQAAKQAGRSITCGTDS